MKCEKVSGFLAAATVLMMVAYTGNGLSRPGTAPPSETEAEPALVETVPTTRPTETTHPPETVPPPTEPELEPVLEAAAAGMDGKSIFVYDVDSGKMLYCSTEKTDRLYPASITKLFTAWLALKHLEPDRVITVGEEVRMVGVGSSLAYISPGCRLTVEMLVEAMLLPSGNDAAYALAAAAGRVIAGEENLSAATAVQRFVAEMNQEAGRLGMDSTNFTNPDGYHTGAHYSCPGDLALIGALIDEPRLLLLDEPFVGLDPKAAFTLKQHMREMTENGAAIFFSTHVLEVAEKLCNKVAIINHGKLVAEGDMDTVKGNDSLEELFMELVEKE